MEIPTTDERLADIVNIHCLKTDLEPNQHLDFCAWPLDMTPTRKKRAPSLQDHLLNSQSQDIVNGTYFALNVSKVPDREGVYRVSAIVEQQGKIVTVHADLRSKRGYSFNDFKEKIMEYLDLTNNGRTTGIDSFESKMDDYGIGVETATIQKIFAPGNVSLDMENTRNSYVMGTLDARVTKSFFQTERRPESTDPGDREKTIERAQVENRNVRDNLEDGDISLYVQSDSVNNMNEDRRAEERRLQDRRKETRRKGDRFREDDPGYTRRADRRIMNRRDSERRNSRTVVLYCFK